MSDGQPPPTPTAQPPEPLPESFNIPAALAENWLSIAPQTKLAVELRRSDLDSFHFSLNRCIEAQYVFQDCMIDHSNGQVEAANTKPRRSQRTLMEAQNALRQFMAAVMASAATAGRP